jgi:predicted phosphodiesterase
MSIEEQFVKTKLLRVIGDVHGKFNQYAHLIKDLEYSVQLGDMGLNYEKLEEKGLDANKHKFIRGNHDNFQQYSANALPDYFGNTYLGDIPFFYISGADSIDKQWRIPYVSWWPEEEMGYTMGEECIDMFAEQKSRIVLSHTCPTVCLQNGLIGDKPILKSATSEILSQCLEAHKPEVWIFGHFHKNWAYRTDKTRFVCLNELQYVDLFYSEEYKRFCYR